MKTIDYIKKYKIEKLNENHCLNDFECGNEKLDEFLKYKALKEQKNNFNVTYLAIYDNKILGYYSLLAENIKLKHIDFDIPKNYNHAPAIKIGQLARDLKVNHTGFGTELLDQACKIIKNESEKIGIKYITVDAYVYARNFYIENGFKYTSNVNLEKVEKAEKRNPTQHISMYKNVEHV